MNNNKFTKKDILNQIKSKKPLEELFNPNGIEISGGVPVDMGDQITCEPTDSLDKKATQSMNQQDKLGYVRSNNQLVRRESKFDKVFNDEISKIKQINEVDILNPETSNIKTIETIKNERPEV